MRNYVSSPPKNYASNPPKPDTPRRGLPYAAIAAAGVVGIAAGLFIPSPVAETETATPTACIEAIDLADEALAVTSNAMGTISEAFTALSIGSETLASVIMEDLDEDTQKISDMQADYRSAKNECRASHDQ